jgi:hypothetical protein
MVDYSSIPAKLRRAATVVAWRHYVVNVVTLSHGATCSEACLEKQLDFIIFY